MIVPASAQAESRFLAKAVQGTAPVQSIDVITFGPEGLLLIGDGAGQQILAVNTGDVSRVSPLSGTMADFQKKLADRIGCPKDGVEILDLAVNPASGRAYVAVRKQDDKQTLIFTVDGSGTIDEFSLGKVEYVRVPLAGGSSPIGRVTDIAWADDRVIAAAAATEEFASKIFAVPVPLANEGQGQLASAETYHVSHHRWETKAPMSTIVPFRENGRLFVVGAFACTPIVKYPVDAITTGEKVKGTSVIELGSGNRPLDMISYTKDGKDYVLCNTFRHHHEKRPISPGPYWTARFDRALLGEEQNVNENALLRVKDNQPATDRIQMVNSMHGVVQLDKLDDANALVLRTKDGQLDLEVVALP
jgi:hypothetical protein